MVRLLSIGGKLHMLVVSWRPLTREDARADWSWRVELPW